MEPGQRFILWCLFINTAFPETGKKICFCRKPFPLFLEWKKNDIWTSPIQLCLGYIFYPDMYFWISWQSGCLEVALVASFFFPQKSLWIKQHFCSMSVPCFFFDLKKLLLLFIYSKNIEKHRRVKKLSGVVFSQWVLIWLCCLWEWGLK